MVDFLDARQLVPERQPVKIDRGHMIEIDVFVDPDAVAFALEDGMRAFEKINARQWLVVVGHLQRKMQRSGFDCSVEVPIPDGVEGEGDRCSARTCLLYTSDAADERSSVDLGGRRIIKKNNEQPYYMPSRQDPTKVHTVAC